MSETLRTLGSQEIIFHGAFLGKICEFIHAKTIVEIGTQYGKTMHFLCEAASRVNGMVFGYDYFDKIGKYTQGSQGDLDISLKALSEFNNFKLTKINTMSDEFAEVLKKDTRGKIDFAFIDGCHSYGGVKNDFRKVFPLLAKEGMIAFHDTFSHVGLRKFVISLYEELNDGTFDIINLPFGGGNKRHGITLLSKRSYPNTNTGISNISHDPQLPPCDIYTLENTWYNKMKARK